MNRFSAYYRLIQSCVSLLGQQRRLFLLFIALGVLGAFTEGMSVTLLVPLLDSAGGQAGFRSIPVLGQFAAFFEQFEPAQRMLAIAAAILVLVLVRGALQYSVDVLANLIPLRLQRSLACKSYRAFLGVRIGYIHARDAGVISHSVTELPMRVSQLLVQFSVLVWNSLVLLVLLVLMIAVSWPMTIGAVAFLGVVSVVIRGITNRHLHAAGARLTRITEQVATTVHETVNGMRQIRLATAEEKMGQRFGSLAEQKLYNATRIAAMTAIPGPLFHTVAGFFICLLLVINALTYAPDDRSWVGSMLVFLFLLFRLVGPFHQLNRSRAHIVSDMQAFQEFAELERQTAADRQPDGTRAVAALSGGIFLEEISFRYPTALTPTLNGLTLNIRKGEMVALVGPSGAGKSTLVNILTRLYDPDNGRVLVDGVDLRELRVQDWRRRVGVVSQDLFLFNDTIARNIAFPLENVPDEEIHRAAAFAAADGFISELPEGYDTIVGDRGIRLSGGQQQRLAIARAVLSKPDLLILDEATSHLDSVTESSVQRAIEAMRGTGSMLVIAHRLSTIRKADRIAVLKDGTIVEEGSHDALLAAGGIYHTMLTRQGLGVLDDKDAIGS